MKLSTAIQRYTQSVEGETRAAYAKKLNVLLGALGDIDVRNITLADLERFKCDLLARRVKAHMVEQPLSPWYIRGVLRTARQLFRWLYDRQLIRRNPAAQFKLPKEPPKNPKPIEADTFDKLLRAASITGDDWERARNVAFLCLMRDSGGRLGGLLKAQISDLNLEAGVLVTTEKSGQLRTLLFNGATRDALRAWLEHRNKIHPRGEFLFIGGWGKSLGKGLTPSAVYNMLKRLAKVAGVEGQRFNPHSFRHAFARDSIMAGADLSEVSQLMGHSSIVVTADYYARYLPAELRKVHQRTSPGRQIKLPLFEDCGQKQDEV
jgi:site-specific recombinase XerD